MSIKKDINCERGCVFKVDTETGETSTSLTHGGFKLNANDWIEDMKTSRIDKVFEVRFKNTRKGYFENVNGLALKVGDIVAVEGNPGHDIGIVSMCEDMVVKHMRVKRISSYDMEMKKIYRLAKPYDIERWQEAISLEHTTMIKSRQIAAELKLNMKIGDVEYQGDRVKAIFYYIADERVDFRELIKILAEEFMIRIEMKQIGARQEAGKIGGIGSCGRELCCSSFITNFVSVTTNSARFQDILLNPQKLAGQCGKLKCCLNYEVDSYIDARKGFPKLHGPIQTLNQDYFLVKTDIFKGEMTFSTDPHLFVNVKVLSTDTVKNIISMNRRGVKVDELISETIVEEQDTPDYKNVVGDDSITRFDKKIIKKTKKRRPDGDKPMRPKSQGKPNDNRERRAPQSPENKSTQPREPRESREPREPRRDNRPVGNINKPTRNENGENKPVAPKVQQGENKPVAPKVQQGDNKAPQPQTRNKPYGARVQSENKPSMPRASQSENKHSEPKVTQEGKGVNTKNSQEDNRNLVQKKPRSYQPAKRREGNSEEPKPQQRENKIVNNNIAKKE